MNHLGDTNKMVETPRTDEAEKHAYQFKDEFTPVCESKLVRQLERELNAAKERIKRLEEAGNNLLWNFCPEYTSDFTKEQSDALKQWNQAKEAKP
jgi:hypothetical protein